MNSLINHAKVSFYSIVTSIMSWISQLRANSEGLVNDAFQNTLKDGFGSSLISIESSNSSLKINWKNIGQAAMTLTIWILMGFAAGFLIGMISPR